MLTSYPRQDLVSVLTSNIHIHPIGEDSRSSEVGQARSDGRVHGTTAQPGESKCPRPSAAALEATFRDCVAAVLSGHHCRLHLQFGGHLHSPCLSAATPHPAGAYRQFI